jgi:hypothetical protein
LLADHGAITVIASTSRRALAGARIRAAAGAASRQRSVERKSPF